MVAAKPEVDPRQIEEFCRRWNVAEFSLFGSILRNDFRPDSDVDVLLRFRPGATWDLFDLVQMKQELEQLFGRRVDVVEEAALRNPFRRHSILSTKSVVYAAGAP